MKNQLDPLSAPTRQVILHNCTLCSLFSLPTSFPDLQNRKQTNIDDKWKPNYLHFVSSSIVFYTLSLKENHIQVSNTISCQCFVKGACLPGLLMKMVKIMLEPAEESSFIVLLDTAPNSNKQRIEQRSLEKHQGSTKMQRRKKKNRKKSIGITESKPYGILNYRGFSLFFLY